MKKLATVLTFACALCAQALLAAPADEARGNYAATRAYYARLIAGPAPQLAELRLFATLLPKGGDLHHHYSGAIYVEDYLDALAAAGGCVFSATDAALRIEIYRVATKPQTLAPAARALCLTVDQVRQDNAFYRELLQHWSDKDFDNHSHAQKAPDQQFFDTFGYFGPVSVLDYNTALRMLKARAEDENVGYLETMLKVAPTVDKPELAPIFQAVGPGSGAADIASALDRAYALMQQDDRRQNLIDTYLKSLQAAAAGIDDADFRIRFQTYVSRNSPPAVVFSGLYYAFAAAAGSPLLVGVNIVGPENGVLAMRDYSLHMKMIAYLKRRNPGVRLALHAGELAPGMVPPEGLRFHIRAAVEAGAERIGHGVDIAQEDGADELLMRMRQRHTVLEVNLSSNEFILGIKDQAHPLPLYRRSGVPYVICTDDAGVSRSSLSQEYVLYASRYKPGYDELKRVVYDSIRYAFLSADDKRDELARLDRRFAAFERRIARLPRNPPAQ
jgi:adenosine deaminase/adenosine deaminase CECR1